MLRESVGKLNHAGPASCRGPTSPTPVTYVFETNMRLIVSQMVFLRHLSAAAPPSPRTGRNTSSQITL